MPPVYMRLIKEIPDSLYTYRYIQPFMVVTALEDIIRKELDKKNIKILAPRNDGALAVMRPKIKVTKENDKFFIVVTKAEDTDLLVIAAKAIEDECLNERIESAYDELGWGGYNYDPKAYKPCLTFYTLE
jgi:hypothetical protein